MAPLRTLALLVGAAVLTAACAQRPGGQSPEAPGDGGPFVMLEPMPSERVPVPEPLPDALPDELTQDVQATPLEMLAFSNRLTEEFGESPDLGVTELVAGTSLIVRWHGDPPERLRALIDVYAGAPFEIRLEDILFRPGDLSEEAGRLVREHPGIVTGAGPCTEGDGVTVGIDPAVAPHPDRADLAELGIASRFPLFPEAMGQAVPA